MDGGFVPVAPSLNGHRKDGPVYQSLAGVVPRDVDWLDEPFLPRGELVTNNADGGTGKGLFSVMIASRLTLLGLNVLFAVAEESVETMLVPRLIAAGANLERVKTVAWTRKGFADPLRIPDDVPQLERGMEKVSLLVVDPLLSHLSARTNSYVDHEVKRALQPLVDLAHRTGCTVLGNGHFGKDKTRGAVSAAQGSTAFINTPRLAIGMAYDDEDPDVRVAEVVKSNIGIAGEGRNFRVVPVVVEGVEKPVPRLEDEGVASKSLNTLLLANRDVKRVPSMMLQEALLVELAKGQRDRDFLNRVMLSTLGASADSVYKFGLAKLKDSGEAKCWKDGTTGGWWWGLTRMVDEHGHPSSMVEPNVVSLGAYRGSQPGNAAG